MLRLKEIPPEQMPEVLRLANELYEQDEQRKNFVAAAEEMGVPQEYLERAADQLHRRNLLESSQVEAKSILRPVSRIWPVVFASLALAIGLVLSYFLSFSSGPVAPPMEPAPPTEVVAPAVPEVHAIPLAPTGR